MTKTIFLDSFSTVSDLRGKARTYENIKAAVLAAGRFSCFDVRTKRDGEMFTRLCRDPEIETFDLGYPWTGVRKKNKSNVYDMGEVNGMRLTYVNGAVFATPKKGKK